MKAVFDTNILIDYLIGNLLAKKEIEQYHSPQISIITKMEILVGVTDNEEIIKEFLFQMVEDYLKKGINHVQFVERLLCVNQQLVGCVGNYKKMEETGMGVSLIV
jgi:predicted nucleic acid-binding protein